jgi:1-acyl-sn-glycerol-3-phosphate acyltransferase
MAKRLSRIIDPILRLYFRSEVRGVQNFPAQQTMLVANHDGGMLPVDGWLIGSAWHHAFNFSRPLGILVHDMVMRLVQGTHRIGAVLADGHHLQAVLDAGHSVLVYPGGSRETFRSFFDRKTVTLGYRTGFIKHALRRHLPITTVVSAGVHETFFVLWRGGWLADWLGITRHFRADVFPIVAGLPFGVWLGALMPHFPLPAKITVEVLPPIHVVEEAEQFLGRPLRDEDLEDPAVIQFCFERVRGTMQDCLTRLYAERRYPMWG